MVYFFVQMSAIGGVCLAAYLVGKGVFLHRLKLEPLEEIGILVPFGLGVFIIVLFFLALLHELRLTTVLASTGLLASLGAWRIVTGPGEALARRFAAGISARNASLALLLAVLLIPAMLVALAPPFASDEIRYHLPYALHFVEQQGLQPNLELRYPFFSLNINLLYSLSLLIGDDVTPHFMHLLLGLLVAVNLFSVASRFTSRTLALSATLLFLATPTFLRLASTAYIDLGLACFCFSAFACLFYADKENERPVVFCAAVLFGIALGSKYLALAFLPLILAWTFHYTRDLRATGFFLALAIVVGLPWYAYNYAHTGNPISPFAGEVFGYWPWSSEDARSQMEELSRHGTERTLLSFLTLPYALIRDHWDFQSARHPVVLLAVFPAFLFLPYWNRKAIPFGILFAAAWIAWFFSSQILRYLAAFLPIWCILATLSLHVFFSYALKPLHEAHHRTIAQVCVGCIMLAVYLTSPHLVYPGQAREFVRERERVLQHELPEYSAIQFIRERFRDEVILQMQAGSAYTYIRTNKVVGDWFGEYRYPPIIRAFKAGHLEGERYLQAKGVTLVLVNRQFANGWPGLSSSLASLQLEYGDDTTLLYRLGRDRPSSGLAR
jgi:hypothetical protein